MKSQEETNYDSPKIPMQLGHRPFLLNGVLPMGLAKITTSSQRADLPAHHANEQRERLGSVLRLVDQFDPVPATRDASQPVTQKEIRALLRLRRNRDRFFPGEMFADPAWDMLLELYSAELGQQRISVGRLCSGAAVPMTTALRWIKSLEKAGLIGRRSDPMDGRRYFVSLTNQGLRAMSAYFGTVPAGAALI
jgi:DNA-binding MarR family transcriptional regulator